MNTKHLIGSVGLICAVVASGSVYAEVGIRDGADHFTNLDLTKSRAEVQSGLRNSRGEGTSISMRDGDDSMTTGAYGVAGSRYSRLTREEVKADLENARKAPRGDWVDSLYFGG